MSERVNRFWIAKILLWVCIACLKLAKRCYAFPPNIQNINYAIHEVKHIRRLTPS